MPSATPILAEPLETAAPRLMGCMEAVISTLRQNGVSVETGNVFLLDLTACSFLAPRALDGIPIQMNFTGSVPPWADRVRFHLHVHLLGERRWSVYEPPKGFNVQLIASRILSQLDSVKRAKAERERIARDRDLAEERLARLGESLSVFQETPFKLLQDNLKIEGLPDFPNQVQITVRTSHANAMKIVREFRAPVPRPRKP